MQFAQMKVMLMEKLKPIIDEALAELENYLTEEQRNRVSKVVETVAIRGMLEGQHQAVDVCKNFSEEEMDTAHVIATAIRKKNDALITNLSSMR